MTPHRIRLRGPWQCEPLSIYVVDASGTRRETVEALPAATIVQMSGCDLPAELSGFQGRIRLRRAFHEPTNLEPRDRVWLCLEPCDAHASVSLNERELGCVEPGRGAEFDVTARIGPQNVLLLETLRTAPATRIEHLAGEARLEIRAGLADSI